MLEIEPEHSAQAAAELVSIAGADRLAFVTGSVPVDIDVARAFDVAQERFGPVGMLVNNAGTAAMSPIVDMTEEDWDLIVDTCMKGTFLCTRAFARQAIDAGNGGAIVNISSLNAIAATDGLGHYCAAKVGIAQFTKVAAGELGRYGIRVNAIAPGTTDTPPSPASRSAAWATNSSPTPRSGRNRATDCPRTSPTSPPSCCQTWPGG